MRPVSLLLHGVVGACTVEILPGLKSTWTVLTQEH